MSGTINEPSSEEEQEEQEDPELSKEQFFEAAIMKDGKSFGE